jgi:hypothetical protein
MSVAEEQRDEPPEGEAPDLPPFVMLCLGLGAQARVALGLEEDPISKQTTTDLPTARQTIDLLGMLEQKTKGNLSGEESGLLSHVLGELRMLYVQAATRAAK